MILNVIKWCTVQGQLGPARGQVMWLKMAAISSLILSHPLSTDEEGRKFLPIRAL